MGVFEVKRIVAKKKKRIMGGQEEYLIQWKDYSPAENTWEPADHFSEELIAAYISRSASRR